MKKIFLIIALILVILVLIIIFNNNNDSSNSNSNKNQEKSITKVDSTLTTSINFDTLNSLLPAVIPGEQIIKHKYYTIGYNPTYKEADWVAYKLTSSMISGNEKRKNNYRTDPLISYGASSPSDYKKSGYDRGHLCPAADMNFDEEAMSETFYMSNMTPQSHQFNAGIWEKLEKRIREWAEEYDGLFITTGPVIVKPYSTIGADNVAVPKYFYKVIVEYDKNCLKGIGFIMENKSSQESLESFAVSIDSVESFTGYDFFEILPDNIECSIEKQSNYSNW